MCVHLEHKKEIEKELCKKTPYKLNYVTRDEFDLSIKNICDYLKNSFNIVDEHKVILEDIVYLVAFEYRNRYKYNLTYEILFEECKAICKSILDILFDPCYFKRDGLLFLYGKSFLYSELRDEVKEIILDKIQSSQMQYLDEYDAKKYVKIAYDTLYRVAKSRFKKFFVMVENFTDLSKFDCNLSHVDSATRHYVKCLILKYIKSNPDIPASEIAKIFSVDPRTVSKIKNKYKNDPKITYQDIREKPRGPAPRFFTIIPPNVFSDLINVMVHHTPIEFDLNGSSWTGDKLVEYLKKIHNITVKRSYIYYLLRKFEITSKVGRRINPKRDLNDVINFLQVEFRRICMEAKKNGERVIWADETYCQQGYNQRGFAPIGIRANLSYSAEAKHTSFSLFIMIGPDGLVEIFKIDGSFNAEVFQKFLKELHKKYKDDKFVLILDNSRVHHALLITKWLNTLQRIHKSYIRLEYLPAYCPDLNPVEFMNNDFKIFLRKSALCNRHDVIKATNEYIKMYKNGDKKAIAEKVKKFFQAPSCIYSWEIYNEVFGEAEC